MVKHLTLRQLGLGAVTNTVTENPNLQGLATKKLISLVQFRARPFRTE